MKLTISAKTVKKLKPKEKVYDVRDDRLIGFILRVYPSGKMTYYAEYGRGKRVKIGESDRVKPAQARDEADDILAGAKLGKDPIAERKREKCDTLAEYLDNVYEDWAVSHLKTGHVQVKRIRSRFENLLDLKLTQITPWLIEKHRSKRLKKVTTATVNRDVQALRAALRRASDWGIIEEHPLQKVKSLKEDRSARIRYLTPGEEKRLRAALDDREEGLRRKRDLGNAWRRERGYREMPDLRALPFADRMKPLTLISLNTGIRRGEAFNLQWSDIDLSMAMLTVGGSGEKTNQTRHVPLNSEALYILRNWRRQSHGSNFVFPSDTGGRLDNVNKSWRSILTRAKIQNFRWHDLRHSFASKLVIAGVDLNTVRELLGHSDIKMTLRYAHLAPQVKAAAVEKLVNASVSSADTVSSVR